MAKNDKYKVMMGGNDTEEVTIGYLEKGNSVPKGRHEKVPFRRGNTVFPNRTLAWGRRLVDGKAAGKTEKGIYLRVEPNNINYTGQVEWLEYGDPKGYSIEARYLKGCSSLDYQYQMRVGYPTFANDLEHNYVDFPSGLNEFEYDIDPVLIEFLKIHHENRDSKSKNPDNGMDMFREVKVFDIKKQTSKEIDEEFDAVKIVKDATSFDRLNVLKTVLSSVTEITFDPSKESSLYDTIVVFARKRSKEFLSAIESYKRSVSKLIELGKSYEVFDLTTDNKVVLLKPVKEVLIDEVKVKGEDIPQWLFDNCLEPVVYAAIEKLSTYSKKFK